MGIIKLDTIILQQYLHESTAKSETIKVKSVETMPGHAHTEVIATLTIADTIVLAMIFLLLFSGSLYIVRQMKKWCMKNMRREIERAVDMAATQQLKTLKIKLSWYRSLHLSVIPTPEQVWVFLIPTPQGIKLFINLNMKIISKSAVSIDLDMYTSPNTEGLAKIITLCRFGDRSIDDVQSLTHAGAAVTSRDHENNQRVAILTPSQDDNRKPVPSFKSAVNGTTCLAQEGLGRDRRVNKPSLYKQTYSLS